MTIAKIYKETLVNVDSKGRVVLPRAARRSGLYAVEVTANDEIILRPRVAVDPREVIDKRTLSILDESMKNLTNGKVGGPIDLSGFDTQEEVDEEKTATRKKTLRRRR